MRKKKDISAFRFLLNVGNYLNATIIETATILPNASLAFDLPAMEAKAFGVAQMKANDIYTAVKLRWLEELELFEKRSRDYLTVRRNAKSLSPAKKLTIYGFLFYVQHKRKSGKIRFFNNL
jgi:hypothetical protein